MDPTPGINVSYILLGKKVMGTQDDFIWFMILIYILRFYLWHGQIYNLDFSISTLFFFWTWQAIFYIPS